MSYARITNFFETTIRFSTERIPKKRIIFFGTLQKYRGQPYSRQKFLRAKTKTFASKGLPLHAHYCRGNPPRKPFSGFFSVIDL